MPSLFIDLFQENFMRLPTVKTRFSHQLIAGACLSLFSAAFTAQAETVFVTLEKDNALAVLDPMTGQLIKTIDIGQRPRGIAISPDNKYLYIATSDDNTVKIIDAETYKEVGQLPSGEDPETFALNPKGDRLYVSNEDDNLVTVIDIPSKKAIAQIKVGVEPEGIAVSPDNQWVVSASETTNMIHWIDAKTNKIVENTLVDPRPRAAAFTADNSQLWVTSEIAGTLMILDTKTKKIIKTIRLDIPGVTADKIQPVGVVIDKASRWGYVAIGPANRVIVVNAQTFELEKFLLVGSRVWNLAFSPDEKRLYTTNGKSNDVSIIDLENHKVVKSVGVGRFPWGVVSKP